MTLIEVLLVLVILSIASVSIYSTFTTGLKLYQKIAIEGQLRDDADYIATMILNQLHENTPSYIEPYHDNVNNEHGIKLVRMNKTVDRYVVEETGISVEKSIYFKEEIKVEKEKNTDAFYIRDDELTEPKMKISSESSSHTTKVINGESVSSFIKLKSCSQNYFEDKCQHGIIELNLVLENSKELISSFFQTDPIVLNSTFGF